MTQAETDRKAIEAEFDRELTTTRMSLFEFLLWDRAFKSPDDGFRVIWTEGDPVPYLLRVYLRRGGGKFLPGVYLHRFFRGDADREHHNHPWKRAWSLILTKGYLEHRWNAIKKVVETFDVKPGRINRIGRDDFHRVELVRGRCWTLFITWDRVQESDGEDWGFLDVDTEEYTPWGSFVASACRLRPTSPT
jgi:hypothetical protein